jgi:NADH-quinone oxidoreductase subunit M
VFATHHTDLNLRELAALIPLLVLIVWIGVAPQFFISKMEPSIAKVTSVLEAARPAGK